MCGLVGMIAKKSVGFYETHKNIFKQMLYADAVRGHDATGCFGVTKEGNLNWMKEARPSGSFISTKAYDDFSSDITRKHHIVIGHNRKATHGTKKDEDSHPFTKEHITLVHNGMISNHKTFCNTSTVDSQAICNALAKDTTLDVISDIQGAFAFIWYDAKQKTLFFVRNSQRPLAILESDNCFYLASESLLALWVTTRNNEKILKTIDCVEHVLYSINLETKELKEEKLELKKKEPTYQPPKEQTYYGGYQIYGFGDDDESLFLDETTVEKPLHVWAEKGMQVVCEITDYEDTTDSSWVGPSVEITGRLLNCNLKGPVIKTTVDISELPNMLETCVLHGRVKAISAGYESIEPRLYVNLATPCDTIVTKNDMIITSEMWKTDIFPNRCDKCGTHLGWKDLANAKVNITYNLTNPVEITNTCPKCQGTSDNVH